MTSAAWEDPGNHLLGMLLRSDASDETDQRGRRLQGDPLLLVLNGGGRSRPFALPSLNPAGIWCEALNTSHRESKPLTSRESIVVGPHSLVLLRYEPNR